MNRRSFFNKLGAAILGTAIALKIPDSLVPTPKIPSTTLSDLIYDYWFKETPMIEYIRNNYLKYESKFSNV